MKKIIYLSMIVAIFASACSSNKNGIITKRKYTKGYFVDLKGRHKHQVKEQETATVSKKQEVRHVSSPVAKAVQVAIADAPVVTARVSEMVTSTDLKVKPVVNSVNAERTELLKKSEVKPSFREKITVKQALKNVARAQKASSADSNLILLVILSLFPVLALIAIYLKDGKSITMNFWVDLILHFLFLYWLFALLVVLDVFSLA